MAPHPLNVQQGHYKALLFISKYDDAKKGNRDRFFTLYLLASFITCVFPMTKQREMKTSSSILYGAQWVKYGKIVQ